MAEKFSCCQDGSLAFSVHTNLKKAIHSFEGIRGKSELIGGEGKKERKELGDRRGDQVRMTEAVV
ncbi:NADH dehydrogenase (ubiquinone) 1 alpha subcomplex [Musa troglodytarum]|uniref:NADH dehydrogenase (Ubiquinone) 1 alpha subcomplex n=1 Tax=Musa troglodytarum TaxID=320322 RepID=A0A9E7L405_9LILI|nr:NADH dehydrogenase (ubiquinone) 1 alpha subcomplex [Musa troglodytarum]